MKINYMLCGKKKNRLLESTYFMMVGPNGSKEKEVRA